MKEQERVRKSKQKYGRERESKQEHKRVGKSKLD